MRKIFTRVIALVISAILLSFNGVVIAESLETQKANTERAISNATNEKATVQNELSTTQQEVEELNTQIDSEQAEIDYLGNRITDLQKEIETKEQAIEDKQAEYKKNQDLFEKRIVVMYEQGETSFLDVLLDSKSLVDFLTNYYMINELTQCDLELFSEIENAEKNINEAKTQLEVSKSELESTKQEREEKVSDLESKKQQKQVKVSQLSDKEKELQNEIDTQNASLSKINSAIAEAARKAEEARKAAQKKNSSSGGSGGGSYSGGNGSNFDGTFAWPCDCRIITSTVKWRWGRWHKGIDIGCSYEPIYASASGYCYNAYDSGGYGVYVMIFHGNGYVTLYGHLSSSRVSDGEYVDKGEPIATSGNTGGSTGPHLHFEIRRASSISDYFNNANFLNPLDYLSGGYTIY